MADALADIAAERRRQVEVEGWTHEHDDGHQQGELAQAAIAYAAHATAFRDAEELGGKYRIKAPPLWWPATWAVNWWKPKNRRHDLVKAAALLVAEIERLDRAGATQP